jgi:ribosomal protein L37AE/L43A
VTALNDAYKPRPQANGEVEAASLDESRVKVKSEGRRRGVRMCPKCGSTDIFYARGLAQLWSIWECRRCGYYGAFIIEDGKLSKKLQDEYAKKHPLRSRVET